MESTHSSFHVHVFNGGIITLWKRVLITVKVEIGDTTDQISDPC